LAYCSSTCCRYNRFSNGVVKMKAREYGISIGSLPVGRKNDITDVLGVEVGHFTLVEGEGRLVRGKGPVRTGVTVIKPHGGNLFREKVMGAVHVINGYGKSVGLLQVEELGEIETPIVLTNTLSVPVATDALITYMLEDNPDIGVDTSTVNCIVGECNDGFLNDIQGRHVKEEHVLEVLRNTGMGPVLEGSVGAGTGMRAFGYKAGIGSSSRIVGEYVVGCMVLANFGRKGHLVVAGQSVDYVGPKEADKGSVIVVLATDAPLSELQLKRLAKRAVLGLGRVGSFVGHGSGDIVIAFSTVTRILQYPIGRLKSFMTLENTSGILDELFQAVVESVEESVLNSLFASETMVGRDGNVCPGIPKDDIAKVLEGIGKAKENITRN